MLQAAGALAHYGYWEEPSHQPFCSPSILDAAALEGICKLTLFCPVRIESMPLHLSCCSLETDYAATGTVAAILS